MSASASSSTSSSGSEGNSYPSSSSATKTTRSSSSSSSSRSSSRSSSSSTGDHSASASHTEGSSSASSTAVSSSSVTSARSSPSRDGKEDGAAPLKVPRLEEEDNTLSLISANNQSGDGRSSRAAEDGSSIFPAPPLPSLLLAGSRSSPQLACPPPRYGPAFPPPPPFGAWIPPPPPPPLPTLSAAAKDITEMDVRAGVRLGVYRAPTLLNKEQVMDEIESVRMTSSVERVLLEASSSPTSQQQLTLVEEREYAWATVFFADAEAAELCVARLCQPGRRSKWSRLCIQRLPLTSLTTLPLSPTESERYRVHAYQLESAAPAPGAAAATTSAVTDTVLARSAHGWCVLSTGGLFPTQGLATYLRHRRNGDFSSVEVCGAFHTEVEKDTCSEGGKCAALHLREREQWKLLLPVVLLPVKASARTSPRMAPAPTTTGTPAANKLVGLRETSWQEARRADCLVVKPLPADIDESAFVYMFRGCRGFLRAQTVRTVDQVRYGVVQFNDAVSAREAHRQASADATLSIHFYGEVKGTAAQPNTVAGNDATDLCGALQSTHDVAAVVDSALVKKVNEEVRGEALAAQENGRALSDGADDGDTHAPGLPFPPLPEGWEYGLSRRTMQYFFLQSGKKSTTWKHPVTQEQYKAKR